MARYRLLSGSGQVLDAGEGEAQMSGGALVVQPDLGQPLRVAPADVLAIAEPAPYVVLLTLAGEVSLELSALGPIRTDLLSELAARRERDTSAALYLSGIGTPEIFDGLVGTAPATLALYDDLLTWIPSAGPPRQLRYSFLTAVTPDPGGYRIALAAADADTVVVSGLATRTSEFVAVLTAKVAAARQRTAALVATVLPSLPPIPARVVAGLLADGLPAPLTALEAAAGGVAEALLSACTDPARVPCLRELAARGPMFLIWHQRTSVEVAASGEGPLPAPAAPAAVDHGGGSTVSGGLAGLFTAQWLAAGPRPFGVVPGAGGYPVFGPDGFGGFGGFGYGGPGAGLRTTVPERPVPTRSVPAATAGATPAHADLGRLGVAGADASVLAACVTSVPSAGALVYEVLNQGDHATYVYDQAAFVPPGAEVEAGVRRLAAALAAIGYRVSAVAAADTGWDQAVRRAVDRRPELAGLRSGLRGRVIHTDGWSAALDTLLHG